MKFPIEQLQYHRNGVCGAPFHVLIFRDPNAGRMLGVVFAEPSHVAVLQLDKLSVGNIAFGVNSWRGDHYEPYLRTAIQRRDEEAQS
ncbi:MAG: hypothetical protein SFV23_16930 [Planctomycetaceae bacterium]|nr:hypothetical protein [Planctomycetaceae bacterium]